MFGNVPRALWSQWCAPDELGRIELATRCLLVRDAGRVVLLEAGIGVFFDPELLDRYGVLEHRHALLDSLAELGVAPAQVDVVVLSHLHFDHAGGLLTAWQPDRSAELAFPRARFLVGARAWERACMPHSRDRRSFIPDLVQSLEASGRLELVSSERSELLGDRFEFFETDGHTPGMLHTRVSGRGARLTYCADLVPGVPWVHLPVTMGYDRFPERLIDEKRALLERARADLREWLFFTHDPTVAAARIECDPQGRYVVRDTRAGLDLAGFDLDADAVDRPLAR